MLPASTPLRFLCAQRRVQRRVERRLYSHRAPQGMSKAAIDLLSNYLSTSPRPLNLSQLLSFQRSLSPDSVLSSVSYALLELPRRLATRVRSLESLPFIVGTNPYVAKTLEAYRESFKWLATHPPVTDLEENKRFVQKLEDLVQRHANDIPVMAKGFQECSRYMSPSEISNFLDGAIRNRISIRLIAEQHIAVSYALTNLADASHMGVVDMQCSPKKTVEMCGSFVTELCEATLGASPSIIIDGHTDAVFPYVPVHLEYILTEILKNSFRATVEHHIAPAGLGSHSLPPVVVTLSPPLPPRRGSKPGVSFFSIRVRDQGGGVSPSHMARIFSYAFTTAGRGAENSVDDVDGAGGPYVAQRVGGGLATDNGSSTGDAGLFGEIAGKSLQAGIGTIAGLGYGLPMSRLYARYFGGSLEFLSLEGWGSDVFLTLRCLDEADDSRI